MKKWLYIVFLCFPVACGVVDSEEESADDSRKPYPPLGEYFYADWGPDDRLAVEYMQMTEDGESHHMETRGLYTIELDGSDLQPVVLNSEIGAMIGEPIWSPDGEWIAFSAGGEVFKIKPDGSDLTRLTEGGEAKFGPSWSPDGEWIAYRVTFGPDEGRGLWKVSADGNTIKQLRRPPKEEMCLDCNSLDRWVVRSGPSWSKNANEIAYVAFENGVGGKHLAIYDTTRARVEFPHERRPASLTNPKFSPDGSRILFFTGAHDGNSPRIGVINRDGSGLRWLHEHAVLPSWSPCGNHIVYRLFSFKRPEKFGQPGYGDLWIMNADGSENRQITFSTGKKETKD